MWVKITIRGWMDVKWEKRQRKKESRETENDDFCFFAHKEKLYSHLCSIGMEFLTSIFESLLKDFCCCFF